jgi:predicted dehydrogenase
MPTVDDQPLGVVQIGAGAAGMAHLRVVGNHPRCRLIAAADVSPQARSAATAEFAVPTYADYRELLDRHAAEAQIAIVVVPHHIYPDVIDALAGTDLHILKEKPFARNLDDARRMAERLRDRGRVYMTSGQRLLDPAYRRALDLVRKGELGDIYLAEGRILYAWNPDGQNWGWRGDRDLSGGTAILDAGWHMLGALTACKGLPERVFATIGSMRACPGDWTSDDKGAMTLEYADGSIATVVSSHVALPDRFELLLHGTSGNLEVNLSRLVRYDRTAAAGAAEEWTRSNLLAEQLDHFLACVDGRETPESGLNESLDLQRIVEAAYRSAATRQPVDLGDTEVSV